MDYQFVELIGQGTYGQVYRATRGSEHYAIKRCHIRSNAITQTAVELMVTNTYRHPNIINLIDLRRDAHGFWYLVYPLGVPLDAMTITDLRVAVAYLYDVLLALQYLHSHGLMHCDVKPDNIIIVDRRACLADFGCAVADYKQPKVAMGGGSYRAPEANGTGRYSPAVDMWAFGLLASGLLQECYEYNWSDAQRALCDQLLKGCSQPDPNQRFTVEQAMACELFAHYPPVTKVTLKDEPVEFKRLPLAQEAFIYDWLLALQQSLQLQAATIRLAIAYFERSLAVVTEICPSKLQLLALGSLFLAMALIEPCGYPTDVMYKMVGGKYSQAQIEEVIWEALTWLGDFSVNKQRLSTRSVEAP